jgi:type I restriction enzyme M protein
MSNPTALVQKLWNYCNILRDDGLSYGDYVEKLIPPLAGLFFKMADEALARGHQGPPYAKVAEPSRLCSGKGDQRRDAAATVPKEFAWPSLLVGDGIELPQTPCGRVSLYLSNLPC